MAGGTRSYYFARKLVERGHEVHLITSSSDSSGFSGWHVEDVDGISVHSFSVPYSNNMGFSSRMLAFLKFATLSTIKAVQLRADLVFATSTPLTIAIPGIISSKLLRKSFVFEVRDLWPEVPIKLGVIKSPILKFLAKSLEKIAYSSAKTIITLSPGMYDGVKSTVGSDEKLHIITNISNLDIFSQGNSDKFFQRHPDFIGKKIVLYAGTLGKVNGVGYLVDVAKHLRTLTNSICIVVFGDGIEKNQIIAQARRDEVLNVNFFVFDAVAKDKLVDVFSAASLSLSTVIDVPELFNNSANKFFDTLAAGRPVGINHGGWQADLISQYKLGVVLSRDVSEASGQLVEFMGNEKELLNCGNRAFSIAVEKFEESLLSNRFVDILEGSLRP